MRQIVLDTETTGLVPREGHRIVEIGAVELEGRRFTGRTFHEYINPERDIPAEVIEVHGITNEMVADKPVFADIAESFLEFIQGAELIIHNAPFDIGFLDHELKLLSAAVGRDFGKVEDRASVLDSLLLARKMHPGQRNTLDALCKRYDIDNSHRTLHGALLDSEILADVYLRMTGGQTALILDAEQAENNSDNALEVGSVDLSQVNLRVVKASEEELKRHLQYLQSIKAEQW